MKSFDREGLSKFDGKEGRPTYIAYGGKVFDVSNSKMWKDGRHMRLHHGGNDLTSQFPKAPHGEEVFKRYPQVGVLKKDAGPQREVPAALSRLLKRMPLLRRHPHPMTVHFPIVFMFSTTVFNGLYLVTGTKAFEVTALHCLGAGILFTPVAILTGLYTWWLNYLAKPLKAVLIKRRVSVILFIVQIAVFAWRLAVPGILDTVGFASLVYCFLVLCLLFLVTVIGWFGAMLTFPLEKE